MTDFEDLERQADEVLARSRQLLDDVRGEFRNSDSPVSVQPRSANSKLAPQRVEIAKSGRARFCPKGPYVASTYVSIAGTCPDSCEFKAKGCYAKAGATHLTMSGLDRGALGLTALDITRAEAAAIDNLCKRGVPADGAKGGRDLRLHVGGEVSCTAGARLLAAATERWLARGGGSVWTFTHRWRQIPREAWGRISVLASCATLDDVDRATQRGYASAIVVPSFPDGSRPFGFAGRRAVPCLAESARERGDMTCATCRICMKDHAILERGDVIAFSAHGSDADEAADAVRLVPTSKLVRTR